MTFRLNVFRGMYNICRHLPKSTQQKCSSGGIISTVKNLSAYAHFTNFPQQLKSKIMPQLFAAQSLPHIFAAYAVKTCGIMPKIKSTFYGAAIPFSDDIPIDLYTKQIGDLPASPGLFSLVVVVSACIGTITFMVFVLYKTHD